MINWHAETKDQAEKEIEEFEAKHAKLSEEGQEQKDKHQMVIDNAIEDLTPFAKITEVKFNSPACKAGIQVGDLVMQYGACNYLNHNDLNYLIDITKEYVNKPIGMYVRRYGFEVTLTIVPGPWDGPGILGCRFDKI